MPLISLFPIPFPASLSLSYPARPLQFYYHFPILKNDAPPCNTEQRMLSGLGVGGIQVALLPQKMHQS